MNLQYHAFLDLIIFLFFMFNADSVLLFRSILQNHNYGSASPLGQLRKDDVAWGNESGFYTKRKEIPFESNQIYHLPYTNPEVDK
jgi:hypothetical protein